MNWSSLPVGRSQSLTTQNKQASQVQPLLPTSSYTNHRSVHDALYSDCLRRESNFLASTRQVTALSVHVLLHCMRVRLCNGYTQAYVQIIQHTHTHNAVTGRVEAKKVLSRRRQSNYSRTHITLEVRSICRFDMR